MGESTEFSFTNEERLNWAEEWSYWRHFILEHKPKDKDWILVPDNIKKAVLPPVGKEYFNR